MNQDLAMTRQHVESLRDELRGDVAGLRRDVAELRAEVDAIVPKLVAANLATIVAITGVLVGVAAVFR